MDLAIQLNLTQPKGLDAVAAESAFSDDTSAFAEVLQRELAAEDDGTVNLDAPAGVQIGDIKAAGNALGVDGWLAGAPQQAAIEQLAIEQLAAELSAEDARLAASSDSELSSNVQELGQEVAAAGLAGRLIDATVLKAELPVEPGQGASQMRLNQWAGSGADSSGNDGGETAGLSAADELAFTDPQTGKRYQALAEFAHAMQSAGDSSESGTNQSKPHLFDLIGRARDFKPSALEQLSQSHVKADVVQDAALAQSAATDVAKALISSEALAAESNAALSGKVAASPLDGVAVAGKPAAGQQLAVTVAVPTAEHPTLADDSADLNVALDSTAALQENGDSNVLANLPQAGLKKVDSQGAQAPQRMLSAGMQPAGSSVDNAVDTTTGTGNVSEAEARLIMPQLADMAVSEPATKKTTSFAEHMRAVNQQLKLQSESPAQQQASADPQQKGQDQASQQQAMLPGVPQSSPVVAGTAASQTTFANALHTEQQTTNSTTALTHGHSTGSSNVTAAMSRPATDFSAPVQLYEQQAAAQLKDKVVYQLTNKIQSAEIRLNPEDLGSVQIKLNLQQDQLNLQFTVSQPHAKEALEQQMPRLRELLEQQGLALGQSHVEQRSSQQQEQSRQFAGNSTGQNGQDSELPGPAAKVQVSDRLVDYYA